VNREHLYMPELQCLL